MYFAHLFMVLDIVYYNPGLTLDEIGEKILSKYGTNLTTKILAEGDIKKDFLKRAFLDTIISIKEDEGKYFLDKNSEIHFEHDKTKNQMVKEFIRIQSENKREIDGD